MALNITDSCQDLCINLNAFQIRICAQVLIVIMEQNGGIFHGRETEGGNSLRTQKAAVRIAGTDICMVFDVAVRYGIREGGEGNEH